MIFSIIDLILRLTLIVFFGVFLVQSYLNHKLAVQREETQAKKYFAAHIIFFLLSLISFIQAEVDLLHTNLMGSSIYPSWLIWEAKLGGESILVPIQSILFIGLLVPSILPIVYVIEKELLKFKFQILSLFGIGLLSILILTILVPSSISITIIPVLIGVFILCFSFISIYIKLMLNSDGEIKKSAIYSLVGWVLLVIGFVVVGIIIVLVGDVAEPTIYGVISHSIAIGGVILIFEGSRTLKK